MRDRLIEIGDIYFIVAKFIPNVTEVQIILKFRNKYIAQQVENDCKWYSIKRSDLGKTVFLTKEEAEEKLKELNK